MENELGKIISYRRGIRGLSLSEVGNRIGYSAQAISRFEKGKVQVGMELWGELCKTLDVSVRSFVKGDIARLEPYYEGDVSFQRDAFISLLVSKRLSSRLQKKRLAEKIEANRQKISKWENGESLPNLHEFKALANYYGLDYGNFYFAKDVSPFALSLEPSFLPSKKQQENVF